MVNASGSPGPRTPGLSARFAGHSILALVLVALLLVEIDVARSLSVTCDETVNVGLAVVCTPRGDFRLGSEHPPLLRLLSGSVLRAAGVGDGPATEALLESPRLFVTEWPLGERVIFDDNPTLTLPGSLPGGDSVVVLSRLPLLVFPLLLAAVTYLWSRSRFGERAGLVSLLLLVSYPDFLGHGALFTADVPLAALATAGGYALDRLVHEGGRTRIALVGLALGCALGVKCAAVFFVLSAVLVCALASLWPTDPAPADSTHPFGQGTAGRRAPGLALVALGVLAVASAVIWGCYLGANPFLSYAHALGIVSDRYPTEADGFLLGLTGPRRWWFYFAGTVALKTPLATIAVLALGAWLLVRTATTREALRREVPLHLPALVFFVAMSLRALPNGSRYVLPCLPFLFVSAGRVALWAEGSRRRWALLAALLTASLAGTALERPFYADATNLLVGERRTAYRALDNSNVDWGGGLKSLAAWQREHDARPLVVVPFTPAPFVLPPPPATTVVHTFPSLGHLQAYGVEGTLAPASVVFEPAPGKVYAVSAHVVAQARVLAQRLAERARQTGSEAVPLVLGNSRAPDAVVGGGYLVFDLRPKDGR